MQEELRSRIAEAQKVFDVIDVMIRGGLDARATEGIQPIERASIPREGSEDLPDGHYQEGRMIRLSDYELTWFVELFVDGRELSVYATVNWGNTGDKEGSDWIEISFQQGDDAWLFEYNRYRDEPDMGPHVEEDAEKRVTTEWLDPAAAPTQMVGFSDGLEQKMREILQLHEVRQEREGPALFYR